LNFFSRCLPLGVFFVNPKLAAPSCYMTVIALDGTYVEKPFNATRY
jgi:hypothetical protein